MVLRFVLALCLVAVAVAALADDKSDAAKYYPLQVGNVWTYSMTQDGAEESWDVTERVTKASDDDPAQITLEVDSPQGGGIEILSVQKDGVYRHEVRGYKLNPPLRIVAFPLKDGVKWSSKSDVAGFTMENSYACSTEKVKVPAGEFDAVVITGGNPIAKIKAWYAPGVGKVKQISQGLAGSTQELKSYKLAETKPEVK